MRLRILSAVVLAPIVLYLIWSLSVYPFALALGVVWIMALYEYAKLSFVTPRYLIVTAIGLVVLAVFVLIKPFLLLPLSFVGGVFWLCQSWKLKYFSLDRKKPSVWDLLVGGWILLFSWSALVFLHITSPQGSKLVLALLMIVWSTDTFSYFVGKSFGKRKLAPALSPGKTVEGMIGGLIGACLAGIAFIFILQIDRADWLGWMCAVILSAAFSVVGDLHESRLKRLANVKDSGTLIPGHGGVLDRIDGVVAAAPVFVSIWYWSL